MNVIRRSSRLISARVLSKRCADVRGLACSDNSDAAPSSSKAEAFINETSTEPLSEVVTGYPLVLQRAASILVNVTERQQTKLLHINAHTFLTSDNARLDLGHFLGKSTVYAMTGVSNSSADIAEMKGINNGINKENKGDKGVGETEKYAELVLSEDTDKLPFNHASFQVVVNIIKTPEQLQSLQASGTGTVGGVEGVVGGTGTGAVLPAMLSMAQMLQYVSSQVSVCVCICVCVCVLPGE